MNVLFTIAGLHPESGGPARSVPALATALARRGVGSEILSLDYREHTQAPLTPDGTLVRTTYVDCGAPLAHRLQWTRAFKDALRARARDGLIDIVHDTGLWLLTNHVAASVSRGLDLPRVLSPRGMLTAWALQHRGWKKKIAWSIYQHRDLETARLLHATSTAEAEDFRAAGLKQPIAVIPNGVDVPAVVPSRAAPGGLRTALYLSRLHPKKGPLNLVEAWARVRPAGWRVVVAGGGEGPHRAELEAAIEAAGLGSVFSLVGPVDDNAKHALYAQADLFVLPSHSENFGIVVAEALASGVPVITTRGTPWSGLEAEACGWWIDTGTEPLVAALRDATGRADIDRRAMGLRGRAWMERDFGWPSVGARMQATYAWLLGQGERPDCVVEC